MADPEAADEVLNALAGAVMTVSLKAAGQAGGLSLAQLQTLTVLAAGPLTLSQLAGAVSIPVDSAARWSDRLVAVGLVDRAFGQTTPREVTVRLTGRGRTELAAYERARLEQLSARLAAVPTAADQLRACLPALTAAVAALTDPLN